MLRSLSVENHSSLLWVSLTFTQKNLIQAETQLRSESRNKVRYTDMTKAGFCYFLFLLFFHIVHVVMFICAESHHCDFNSCSVLSSELQVSVETSRLLLETHTVEELKPTDFHFIKMQKHHSDERHHTCKLSLILTVMIRKHKTTSCTAKTQI